MTKIKKRYIRNGIVFDPNIETDFLDYDYDESQANRARYRKGKAKRTEYLGI